MGQNVLYTCGYGNDAPAVFLKRLADAGVTKVVDIRSAGCRGWCRSYVWGGPMGRSIEEALGSPVYITWSQLSNPYLSLPEYKEWLDSEEGSKKLGALESAFQTAFTNKVVCLLCSERDAYKDGEVNCHRVYVADALIKMLGDGWRVEHI